MRTSYTDGAYAAWDTIGGTVTSAIQDFATICGIAAGAKIKKMLIKSPDSNTETITYGAAGTLAGAGARSLAPGEEYEISNFKAEWCYLEDWFAKTTQNTAVLKIMVVQ